MPVQFSDAKSRILQSIPAEDAKSESARQWVRQRYSTIELDNTPEYASHMADTGNFVQKPGGVNFMNGAWPRKVKGGDITERQRYLQRLMAEPTYFSGVPQMCQQTVRSVAQNNTVDLYEKYFDAKSKAVSDSIYESDNATMTIKTVCVLKDPQELKRAANKIDWHPDKGNRLVVSYATMKFQQMTDGVTPVQSYIWDINHPNEPIYEFIPKSPLTCTRFCNKSQDLLGGGMYNGSIGFFDSRQKNGRPVATSPIDVSHHDPVFDLSFISSRSGNECVSVSTDGQLLWWDIRNLEKPMDQFQIVNDEKEVLGISSLCYASEGGPTRYLVGTEQGIPVLVERKAKKGQKSEKKIKTWFNRGHGGHYRGISSINRNPLLPSFFITTGDWSTKIWSEENIKSPIMIGAYNNEYLTTATWSRVRGAVYFQGKKDGVLDVMDLYSKMGEPVISYKISETPIASISCHANGEMLAVGCEDGSTSILQLGRGLSRLQREEKEVLTEIFEREKKREALVDRLRMVKAKKAKIERKKKAEGAKPKTNAAKDEEVREASIKRADDHWKAMLEKIEKEEKEAEASAEAAQKGDGAQ